MSVEIAFIKLEQSELVTQRTHARIAREVMRRIAQDHIQNRMGKHYEVGPETEPGGAYGYVPRTPAYLRRKLQTHGHQKPNVFTGQERNYVRNTAKITATQTRSRLYLKRLHTRRQVLSDQHEIELSAISPAERSDIVVLAHQWYQDEAAKPENQRQRAPKQRI